MLRRAESLYPDEVQQTPALYRLQYALTDLPLASLLLDSGARRMLRATMRHVLIASPADVAISVFPFYSAAAAAAYGGAPTWPGLMTVVTDLGAVHFMGINAQSLFNDFSYFELGLISMAITSPTKGILEVNDQFCAILGYERSELLQKTWAQMTHPDDLAVDLAKFNQVMDGEIDRWESGWRIGSSRAPTADWRYS